MLRSLNVGCPAAARLHGFWGGDGPTRQAAAERLTSAHENESRSSADRASFNLRAPAHFLMVPAPVSEELVHAPCETDSQASHSSREMRFALGLHNQVQVIRL
jgi:hypothetical protein